MFFNLEYIHDHPCNKMEEVIQFFFRESIDQKKYGGHLFPEWFRSTVRNSPKLSVCFENVFNMLQKREADFRQQVYNQLLNNNCIEEICNNPVFHMSGFLEWDSDLGRNIKTLFQNELYAALDKAVFRPLNCNKKPKKSYYDAFLKKNRHVCPFCGMEKFPNPKGPTRSDLDHYLNKARYPFSAANLKNLVPMCKECNQGYKKAKSVIDDGGTRTPAFYPFGAHPPVFLKITCEKFSENIDDKNIWKAELFSKDKTVTLKIHTWDRVFEIKSRITEEVETYYEDWMEGFFNDELRQANILESLQELRDRLSSHAEKYEQKISLRKEVGAIIKHAFFTYMALESPDLVLNGFLVWYNRRINEQAA